jgi:carboxyl-terminal processing protease
VDEPSGQDVRRHGTRLAKGLGRALLAALAVGIVFLAGNLSSSLGGLDAARIVGLGEKARVASAPSADDEVVAAQLGERLKEAADLLDSDALYRYTQGDLDTATTEAIRALIETGDDGYAHYYTPEEYEAYLHVSKGEYSGIGIVLTSTDEGLMVLQVYEGSPAADAGVLAGDLLLAIDGDRRDWELREATEAISRPLGEEVGILWSRDGEERESVLVLGEVNVPTVVSHLIEHEGRAVGYIHLRRFNAQSASELAAALRALGDEGARSYLLDLRGNPGGYLEQAIEVTSLFVSEGAVVQIEDRAGTAVEEVDGNAVTDKPLVLLVNQGSASASELVAAALRDHGRATIVGESTYGKGTVQHIRKLSWGGALKYTIAHYKSPHGTPLDGIGVEPDLPVPASAGPGSIELGDNIAGADYRYREGVDVQLDAALAALGAPSGEG